MVDIAALDNSASFMRADQAKLKNITDGLDKKTMRQIDQAAEDFEAVFLAEMIKPMFEGIEVDEMFGGGKGEEVFRDLMIQEYGKNMAQAGGIGIASFVKDELIRQQEGKLK